MDHSRILWALALWLLGWGSLTAQIGLYPVPVGGAGVGFRYQNRHLSVAGFLGNGYVGYPYPVFVPSYPLVRPYWWPGPWGALDSRVTVNIITPPAIQGGAAFTPAFNEYDLSGVDLEKFNPPNGPKIAQVPDLIPPSRPKPEIPPPKKEGPPPKIAKVEKVPEPPPPKVQDLAPPEDDPVDENARLTALGLEAFRSQGYLLAAFRFRQATEAAPRIARAYFLLAQAQFALGKYRESVRSIEAGMSRHKDWPQASFQPRQELYKGQEPGLLAQMRALENTLKNNKADAALLFVHAYQLWFDGRRVEAIVEFRRCREFTANPVFIDAFLRVGAGPGPVAANQ